jgi:hypothetical protein
MKTGQNLILLLHQRVFEKKLTRAKFLAKNEGHFAHLLIGLPMNWKFGNGKGYSYRISLGKHLRMFFYLISFKIALFNPSQAKQYLDLFMNFVSNF